MKKLSGTSILVDDDDYYQAADAQQTLTQAGAIVVGPCGQAEDAVKLIERRDIDCAVVDLNLGEGLSFDLPRALMERNIPTFILSGYYARVLPTDLSLIQHLEKPISQSVLVEAIVRLLARRRDHAAPAANN